MQVASFLQKTAQNPVKEKMWVDSVFSLNSYENTMKFTDDAPENNPKTLLQNLNRTLLSFYSKML